MRIIAASMRSAKVAAAFTVVLLVALACLAMAPRDAGAALLDPASGVGASVVGTLTITPSAGPGGAIYPSTPQQVGYGEDSRQFWITPAPGYHIKAVLVDGVPIATASTYTFTTVTADHSIEVLFEVDPSSLTIKTSRTSAYIGQTFVLSGLAAPGALLVGINMHVDVKKPGRSYWSYSSARTVYLDAGNASWWYRYYLDPRKVAGGLVRRGTYQFKGVLDSGDPYTAATSPIVQVYVR